MDEETVNSNTSDSPAYIIKASNVPGDFFHNRDSAKKYFRRFGKVKLTSFKPKRNSILVEFTNEMGMQNALDLAGEYNGQLFSVTKQTETYIRRKRSSKKEGKDPEWQPDPEIRSELEAMGAFYPGQQKVYDFRPKMMEVDTLEAAPAKPKNKWKSASPKPQKKKSPKDDANFAAIEAPLLAQISQPATSIEEKYRTLDARDKLIRHRLKKSSKNSKQATQGTCPDMCPEKERLMRETQHQVSLFEQESGFRHEINPKLAIKQYSRSSADQEAPLPNELRPVNVLEMTMGYLMHQIIDLIDSDDVNVAEWFHFIWDRMRGIRKDITQQEMCCIGSVALVEQCARFHIFCSARLVAEDPSVFDQKINTENLTKCLQTLKYMYHDLGLQGLSCPHEAEFRAYIVLLNLNDGNFMWEVQQLKREIQESLELKFAIAVHSSLDKNNYVRFFKLVKSTTFLNACILMRYFVQMRISALKTLIKSYTPRLSRHSLPVAYLTGILGFENSETTLDFIQTYGLYTNDDKSRIILDKTCFSAPDYPYVLDRAIKLVESKRTQSVGQIVNGSNELPPKLYEFHQPQNSFDQNGYLIWEFGVEPGHYDEIQSVSRPSTPKFSVEEQEGEVVQNDIFNLWGNKPALGVKQDIVALDQVDTSFKATTAFELPSTFELPERKRTPSPDWAEMARIEREKEEEAELERMRLELLAQIALEDEKTRKKKEDEELAKKAAKKAREEEELRKKSEYEAILREKEESLARAKAEKLAKEKAEELAKAREIQNGVDATMKKIISGVETTVRIDKLREIRAKMNQRRLLKIVGKWREITRRKRKRKAVDFTPVWCSTRSVAEEANELRFNSEKIPITNIKRYKLGLPTEIQTELTSKNAKLNLRTTFDILVEKHRHFERKIQNELFWKVNISIPESKDIAGLNFIEKQLNEFIGWNRNGADCQKIEQIKCAHQTITYCIEKKDTTNATNGFIFISDCFSDELKRRIGASFQNFGIFVQCPLVVLLRTKNHVDKAENVRFFHELQQEKIISNYRIIINEFTGKNLREMLQESIVFLAKNVEKPPRLELDTLHGFLQRNMAEFWKRINSTTKWNSLCKKSFHCPSNAIYLYNEVVKRLKEIVLNRATREYPKFPEVFRTYLRNEIPEELPSDWRFIPDFVDNERYLARIEAIFADLTVSFAETWPVSDQVELELTLSKFCTKIIKSKPEKCFYKLMAVFLHHFEGFRAGNKTDFCWKVESVNWVDVIEVITGEKLAEIDFSLRRSEFAQRSIFNQVVVVYDVTTLDDFARSDWFFDLSREKVDYEKEISDFDEKTEENLIEDSIDVDALFEKTFGGQRVNNASLKEEMEDCRFIINDLNSTMEIHKKIFEKSSDFLASALKNN